MTTLKKLSLAGLLTLTACSFNYDYADLSDFDIDYNALKNGDTVEVIAYSGGPDEQQKKYYRHYIVVSKSTGDTVRVLDVVQHDFKMLGNKTKVFLPANSEDPSDKMMFKVLTDGATPEKVVYDKEYDAEVNAKYPTTIGTFLEPTRGMEGIQEKIQELGGPLQGFDSISMDGLKDAGGLRGQ
jgi:hypothetical protein